MTAVRHSVATMARARELHEGGWRSGRIQALLASEGVRPVPALGTIRRWVDPDYHERRNADSRATTLRASLANANYAWPGVRGPEWRLGRMRALRAAGLTHDAIARVMSVDFPADQISKDTVRRRLTQPTAPTGDVAGPEAARA